MANKYKRCKLCNEYFLSGLMVKVPAGTFCCIEHAIEFANSQREKNIRKQHSDEKKVFYAKDKPRQLKAAQAAFNAFIRERDKDCVCISCRQPVKPEQRQAGHYRTFKGLRFNQSNCHLQCIHCNMYLSANVVEYRINLVKKIGVEKVEWLESQNEPLKLSVEDIRSIKVYYTQILKRIKAK